MSVAALGAVIEQQRATAQVPGLAVAVVRPEHAPLCLGVGVANIELDVPVTPDTIFEIASITKLMTAQAIMLLVEDGALQLSDEIGRILPSLPAAWRAITVEQCLRHQSGIPSYTEAPTYWDHAHRDKTHDEVLALVADQPLLFKPGQRYSYDNTGFYLLGLVVEQVSGMAYGDFLAQRLLGPLGMSHTRTNDYAAIMPHRAAGYQQVDGRLCNKPYYSVSNTFSAGNVVSSVADMARWAAGWRGLLSAESADLMWTARVSAEGNERQMGFAVGLGWFFVEYGGHRFAGHNGGIVGFSSSLCHFLDDDTVVIVLANGPIDRPHEIAIAVKEAL